jgi:hypothetical protein
MTLTWHVTETQSRSYSDPPASYGGVEGDGIEQLLCIGDLVFAAFRRAMTSSIDFALGQTVLSGSARSKYLQWTNRQTNRHCTPLVTRLFNFELSLPFGCVTDPFGRVTDFSRRCLLFFTRLVWSEDWPTRKSTKDARFGL